MRSHFDGARVLLTGHTGFKGAWLTLWLARLGARITGFAKEPPSEPNLFTRAAVARDCVDLRGDVRDAARLAKVVAELSPDFVFHLAAQSLVRRSYDEPLETFASNVMGTASVLDALRAAQRPCVAVVVTSDKCYEFAPADVRESRGRREGDRLGGDDPYSASKACAELVTAAYRRSFFSSRGEGGHVRVATVRTGNVIGGGDWGADRLVADIARSLASSQPIALRNPAYVRPWQHVLDPLSGYLWLATRMAGEGGDALSDAWNFGPRPESWRTVREVTEAALAAWGGGEVTTGDADADKPELPRLTLDVEKASRELGWRPVWGFERAVQETMDWYRAEHRGADVRSMCLQQIGAYERDASAAGAPWSQG